MELKLNVEKLEKHIMRKYTEEHDDETDREIESAGLDAIVEVLKDQQESQRKEIRLLEIERSTLRDKKSAKIEKAKHKLEERKYNESRLEDSTSETAHIGKSAKDLSKLPKTALAAKSSKSAKPKAKSGSGTRKKTT